jgi:signal transduction histidine kinase
LTLEPGEPVVLEWEEAYSIGRGDYQIATYQDLPSGVYRFRMRELSVMGVPSGVENSLRLVVPAAWWTTPWLWGTLFLALAGLALAGWRFSEWRQMTRKIQILERDRAVEQERIRIAQDIHDDLGARVTQLSLLSSTAQKKHDLSDAVRRDFEKVSRISRNMVTALYETVWAVSPENDSLDSLGMYLCQMANQMCGQAKLKCRLHVPEFPRNVPIGSKPRHEILLSVKEAIHNAIRHSDADELQLHIQFERAVLTVTVSDNGRGFDPTAEFEGNGLSNMKRRMEACRGSWSCWSRPGQGTKVQLQLSLSEG